jgi:hypothetical protein
MAMIEDLTLEIVEEQGSPVAKVHYKVRGSQQDVFAQQFYRELIELIGVDRLAGEDGQDEPIPGGVLLDGAFVVLTTSPLPRNQRLRLPSSALDEDRGVFVQEEDEIAARVTLTPFPPGPVIVMSNIVRRGGEPGSKF